MSRTETNICKGLMLAGALTAVGLWGISAYEMAHDAFTGKLNYPVAASALTGAALGVRYKFKE